MKLTISWILAFSRRKGKKKQEEMAEALDVSVKTVQNWEGGKYEPTVSQVILWFKLTGENPIPYLLAYVYPDKFGLDLDNMEDALAVGEAYATITKNLTIRDKKALTYLFSGAHGSSPSSVVQLTLAHLNNPLIDRIFVAEHILEQYRYNAYKDQLVGTDANRPDVDVLERAIAAAKESIRDGHGGYVNAVSDVPKVCHDSEEQ